jgi:hypothetical protein
VTWGDGICPQISQIIAEGGGNCWPRRTQRSQRGGTGTAAVHDSVYPEIFCAQKISGFRLWVLHVGGLGMRCCLIAGSARRFRPPMLRFRIALQRQPRHGSHSPLHPHGGALHFRITARLAYKNLITRQGRCMSEIKPSNAILRLSKDTHV